METKKPKRYSTLWVTLHWLIALLLFSEFILGYLMRFGSSTAWSVIIWWHIPLGTAILVLMIIRIIVRSNTPHPEPASAGSAILDAIGVLTHYLLYVFAILMPLAGLSLAISYNLLQWDFGALTGLLIRLAPLHRWIAPIFLLLILLHIGAALFHQIIRKDNLLARMWYGN